VKARLAISLRQARVARSIKDTQLAMAIQPVGDFGAKTSFSQP
jgi:hypothetical protein